MDTGGCHGDIGWTSPVGCSCMVSGSGSAMGEIS